MYGLAGCTVPYSRRNAGRLDLLETLEDRIDLAISAEAVVNGRTGEVLQGAVRPSARSFQEDIAAAL
jgi:hypothetical protein